MEAKIRLATTDDLPEIQKLSLLQFEIEDKNFDDTLNLKWSLGEDGRKYFEESLTQEDKCVFVAQVDDQIAGYIEGGISQTTSNRKIPKFAELEYMFVVEKYRGTGLGTKLFDAFRGWCKEKGVGRLRTEASAKNVRAVNFYKKNGFAEYDLILERNI